MGTFDVFVCHASGDRSVADAIVVSLEGRGLRCWIAPRNVTPGADYAQAIVAGISDSAMLVLVHSAEANTSPHVKREVERAASRGIPILPFRVEDVTLSAGLEYFVSTPQWFDATQPPMERHYARLGDTVVNQLRGEEAPGPAQGDVSGMSSVPRDRLVEFVARFGEGLADDPRRVQALLRDVAGEYRSEIAVLTAAAEEGVGAALVGSSAGMVDATARRLVEQLRENRAIQQEAAAWAVASWGHALGVPVATSRPPVPAPDESTHPRTEAVGGATPPAGEPSPPPPPPPQPEQQPGPQPQQQQQPVQARPEQIRTQAPDRPAPQPSPRSQGWLIAVAAVAVVIAIVAVVTSIRGASDQPTESFVLIAPETSLPAASTTEGGATSTVTTTAGTIAVSSITSRAIIDRGTLLIGVRTGNPPFTVGTGQDLSGFEIDLARELSFRLFGPINIQFVEVSTADRFDALEAGSVDILVRGVSHSTSRDELAAFSSPYFLEGLGLVVRRGGPVLSVGAGPVVDLLSLQGTTIGVTAGVTTELSIGNALQAAGVTADVVGYESVTANAVLAGDADAFATSFVQAIVQATLQPELEALLIEFEEPMAAAVRLGDDAFRDEVDEALVSMIRDGTVASLYIAYIGDTVPWTADQLLTFPPVNR